MKNNKILITIILATIVLCSLLSGCGNRAWFSESVKNEFHYVLVKEGDVCVLHKVKKWADYESDSILIETECCNNIFMTSYNVAVLYKEIPNLDGIIKCLEEE